MKRHKFTVLSLSFLCLMSFIHASSAQSNDIDITKLLPSFYQLWKDSAFGNDPNRTEKAAWIIRKSDGTTELIKWPSSGAWAHEMWVGPLPKNTVAQVHTHPSKRDPKPSSGDRSLSKRISVPLYTISANGIWIVSRGGKITKVTGNQWYKPFHQTSLTPELKGE